MDNGQAGLLDIASIEHRAVVSRQVDQFLLNRFSDLLRILGAPIRIAPERLPHKVAAAL